MKKLYLIIFLVTSLATLKLNAADKEPRRSSRIKGEAAATNETKTCTICLREINLLSLRQHRTLGCSHMFHTTCLSQWEATHHVTCPTCRAPFAEQQQTPGININGNSIQTVSDLLLFFFTSDDFFTSEIEGNFPDEDHPIYNEENLISAYLVLQLTRVGRMNEALRLARFFQIPGLVDYVIARGANPDTRQSGAPITVAITLEIDGNRLHTERTFNVNTEQPE